MITDIKVIDNFYTNPNEIIQLFSGECPVSGCGDSNRSIPLEEISPEIYENFCKTIYSIHGIDGSKVHTFSYFMEHEYNPVDVLIVDGFILMVRIQLHAE